MREGKVNAFCEAWLAVCCCWGCYYGVWLAKQLWNTSGLLHVQLCGCVPVHLLCVQGHGQMVCWRGAVHAGSAAAGTDMNTLNI